VPHPPLFLVLGQPEGSEQALFQASGLSWQVSHALPSAPPIRVRANRDGIYVTCAGASLLGRQAATLAGKAAPGEDEPADDTEPYDPMGRETLRPETAPRGARQLRRITARPARD